MSLCLGPEIIINNAFYARKGRQPFLEDSALRDFCNILYEKITGDNESGINYRYVHFRVEDVEMERFFECNEQYIKGINKVVCRKEVEEEAIKKLDNVFTEILIEKELGTEYKQAIKTVLEVLNNSISNYVLYDLAREMRRNGSNYWADKLCERIRK